MHEPTWAHPRADVYFAFYNLRLIDPPATRGRFFSGRYATTSSGDYVALEEYETDGTTSSLDRVDVRLVIVSTTRLEQVIASRQHHGGIRPVRFESDKIVYEKTRLDETGVVHHFDRCFINLQWSPLHFI